jgi:O-antigen ligase
MKNSKLSVICDRIIECGILLFVFIIPFANHTATIEAIAILVPFLAWMVKLIYVPHEHFSKTPLNSPIMFWGAAALMASAFSIAPLFSLNAFRSQFLTQIVLFFVVVNNIRSEKQLRRILYAFAISTFIFSMCGILGYIYGDEGVLIEKGRALGTFHSCSRSAMYCAFVIPPVLMAFFQIRNKWIRLGLIVSVGLTGALLLFTFTRGPWISLFTVLVILLFKKSKKTLVIFLTAVLVLVIFYGPIGSRVGVAFDFKGRSFKEYVNKVLSHRPAVWERSLHIIRKHPLVGAGYGPNIYRKLFLHSEYKFWVTLPHYSIQNGDTHNLYLQILLETGIIGFAAFIYLLTAYIKSAYKSYIQIKDPFKKDMLFAILLAIIGFLIAGLTGYFYEDRLGLMFWLYMGISMGIGGRLKAEGER